MPVGPNTLWPENTKKSGSSACTSVRMCEIDCAPSSNTLAPARCAICIISAAGVTVPNALDTCVNETNLTREVSSFWYSASKICPLSSTGATLRIAPVSWQSCCQGTILAWCSRCEITISSPAPMCFLPHVLATKLIASVVPRTNTTWSTDGALIKRRTVSRAPS